jgi:hypothetical protein
MNTVESESKDNLDQDGEWHSLGNDPAVIPDPFHPTDVDSAIGLAVEPYLKRKKDLEKAVGSISAKLRANPEHLYHLLNTIDGKNLHVRSAYHIVKGDPESWVRVGILANTIREVGCLHGTDLYFHKRCSQGRPLYGVVEDSQNGQG